MHTFEKSPTMGRVYMRALAQRRPRFDGTDVPRMDARLAAQPLDAAHLAEYREVCGTRADVPLGYLQLLVTPMHVALLTHDEFPIRAMGLIHPRFSITSHRSLSVGEAVRFESWFDGGRKVRNGIEFDIETRAYVDDELVWQSTAATFHRTGTERSTSAPEEHEWTSRKPFVVPADAGRKYARVSGDANPVHLHPLTSRLFGYKKPIAHGWWLVARCLGELDVGEADGAHATFEFRRPSFLGTNYELARRSSDDGLEFAVLDDADKVRLTGSYSARAA